jgi:hypothetical protein
MELDIWWDEGEVFRQIGRDTYGPFKTEKDAEEFNPELPPAQEGQ